MPPKQYRTTEQAIFTYCPVWKALEKQTKTRAARKKRLEEQGEKGFVTVNENIKKDDDDGDDDDDDVLSFCDTGEDSKKISRQRKIFDKLYSKRMERINRI